MFVYAPFASLCTHQLNTTIPHKAGYRHIIWIWILSWIWIEVVTFAILIEWLITTIIMVIVITNCPHSTLNIDTQHKSTNNKEYLTNNMNAYFYFYFYFIWLYHYISLATPQQHQHLTLVLYSMCGSILQQQGYVGHKAWERNVCEIVRYRLLKHHIYLYSTIQILQNGMPGV